MSVARENDGSGEGWTLREWIGYTLLLFGLCGLAGVLFEFIGIWITEVIPFFWSRGDYMPAIFTAAIAFVAVGGALIGSNKETAN